MEAQVVTTQAGVDRVPDVLAMLDAYAKVPATLGRFHERAEIKQARAAAAELVAQRDAMANALVTYRKAGFGNSTDFALQAEASALASLALARVGGAK